MHALAFKLAAIISTKKISKTKFVCRCLPEKKTVECAKLRNSKIKKKMKTTHSSCESMALIKETRRVCYCRL